MTKKERQIIRELYDELDDIMKKNYLMKNAEYFYSILETLFGLLQGDIKKYE